MVTYTLEVDDDLWYDWADTIPRSENLDDRLRQLIREDIDG